MKSIHWGLLLLAGLGQAQQDNLGVANGYLDIETANFKARIVKDAQVLASLQPADGDFDFLPYDLIKLRQGNGQYHWGDITYRYRAEGATEWKGGDSAQARKAVSAVEEDGGALAAASLGATLPEGPLSVTREWLDVDGDLGLRFTVENTGTAAIEVGSLGLPAEFNSIFTGRTAEEMAAHCSLSDPYVGRDAGHIRVAPVTGTGRALVVTPLNGTASGLEAYRNLKEPTYEKTAYGSQTFEGLYEWQVLTKAFAEQEWEGQTPWNEPSAATLKAGDKVQVGVRFSLAEGVRGIDAAIRKTGVPVAHSVPGYIIPRDLPAQLVLDADAGVASIESSPADALTVKASTEASAKASHYTVTPSASAFGRARLTITYDDGAVQTVHYYVTKPTADTLAGLGRFLTTEALFTDADDPFGRAPSVMTYDYEKGAIVSQDARVWVAGLSDEGGAGAYVAAVVKQALQPDADEVAVLEEFVDGVLKGTVQTDDFGVRKSAFYYDAGSGFAYDASIDWGSWTSWTKENSYVVDRAYNYVHPAAAYWALYRVARAYPDVTNHTWEWYLDQAHGTVMRSTERDVWYNDVGLMGETVFGEILKDLQRESLTAKADALEAAMKARAEVWHGQAIPFGSEMAWDSTGQEGVYYWTRHFGFDESATKTVNSVLGYMPNVAHWGWNGNARRYWDFIYGGKLKRIERQIHHYGSGLNAQVLLGAFRDDPSDAYLLRVGYAGSTGPLANINADGFPSAAFHSFPDTLKWDGITGDYGMGFLGMALGGGTYVADDATVGGIVAYGGIMGADGTVKTRDPVRRRVFVGPLGVTVQTDAGVIDEFAFDVDAGTVTLSLAQGTGPQAKQVVVWVDAKGEAEWTVTAEGVKESRGGWAVPLAGDATTVKVARK